MLPLSLLAMLLVLGKDTEELGVWLMWVTVIQVVVLLGSIVPVERTLKKNFDQFGRKR